MKKIQYSVFMRETGNAGGKAKNDAFDIVQSLGYYPSYRPSSIRTIRIIQQIISLSKFDSADIVFVQYPAVDFKMLRMLKNHIKNTLSIALVHDLRSIQGIDVDEDKNEIEYLNAFDYVIVHNNIMGKYIVDKGYLGKTINLELFDYLHDSSRPIAPTLGDFSIVFAGNLTKSRFLNELGKIDKRKFLLYGNKGDLNFQNNENVVYKGMLPSDEIVYKLEGDYGLVWDGDSVQSCTGGQGNYLRYNNPHKLSLYISAGKPIITWRHAAIADFVSNNKIGLVVDSLEELNNLDLRKDYEILRKNVLKIKSKVCNGFYLKDAIRKIEEAHK